MAGIPQNAGSHQMMVAENAMNQEISSLMVCLGQMGASSPQNWPHIIASHGHSLAGQLQHSQEASSDLSAVPACCTRVSD